MADHAQRAPSPLRYILVWVALLCLTFATFTFSHLEHGPAALLIAMLIATAKGTLVVLFFMHIWDQRGLVRIILPLALVLLAILITLIQTDINTRFAPAVPWGAEQTVPRR